MIGPSPLLDALVVAAVDATAARRGWLLAVSGDELLVVAGAGGDAASRVGVRGAASAGWAGSVVASGRPVALTPSADDPRHTGDLVIGSDSAPASLLCFPCLRGGQAVGALQLVEKTAGGPFGLDDLELATMLADVAGAAIDETAHDGALPAPRPEELGSQLRRLAAASPERYNIIAGVVSELLQG